MKRVNSRILFRNKYGYIFYEDEVEKNGLRSKYQYWTRTPGYVAIAAMNKRGQVYLIKNYRYPIKKEILEIPMGYINKGEKPLDAAKRELKEEIGGISKSWSKIGSFWVAPGAMRIKCHIFLAKDVQIGKTAIEEDEEISKPILVSNYKKMKFKEFATQYAIDHIDLVK